MEKFIRKIKCVIFGDYTKPLEEFSHDVKETKFDPSVPLTNLPELLRILDFGKETKFDPSVPLTNLPETLKDLKFPKDI